MNGPAIHSGFDVDRARWDVPYFCRYAVPELFLDELPRYQRASLTLSTDPTILSLVEVIPRGHAKTTLKKGAVLHAMAHVPKEERRFEAFISESQPQAIDDLDDIKHIVTDGEVFPRVYGKYVQPGASWGAEEIETSNRMKLVALGTRQRIRGRNYHGQRFDRIWLDDFESEHNTESPLERDRIKRWVRGAVIPALRKGSGRIVAKGTIVHEDSYLALIAGLTHRKGERSRIAWKRIFLRSMWTSVDPHRALYGNDRMLWGVPHRDQAGKLVAFDKAWWHETQDAYRAEGLLSQFHQEFQNEALPDDPVFPLDGFHFYAGYRQDQDGTWLVTTAEDEERPVSLYLGVDTSTAEGRRSDWCVLMPGGVDEHGNIYQLPYVRERFGKDVTRIVQAIMALDDTYHFSGAEIDAIGGQVYVPEARRKALRERGRWFPVRDNKVKQGKDSKVFSLKPRIDAGQFLMLPGEPSEELRHELVYYRKAKHDDCADAAFYLNSIARPWQRRAPLDPRVLVFPDGREVGYDDATWNWKVA